MGNAYPAPRNHNQCLNSSSIHNNQDAGWNVDGDAELASVLAENVRLRALVVELSNLVLRNVVDQK
jgi:hypothetical protein